MKTTYDAFSMTGDKRRLSEEKNHKRIPSYVKLIIACKGSNDVRWMVIRLKVYATWQTLTVAGDIEVDYYEQGVK